eukprot:gene17700-23290_t
MSESLPIEVYEVQRNVRGIGWVSDYEHPWTYKNFVDCCPPDEIRLPESGDWCWVTNWRIDSKPGDTDADGWEYAVFYGRFRNSNRKKIVEDGWGIRVRRRLWSRIMRRDAGNLLKIVDFTKAIPRIQQELGSIHMSRLRIEEIIIQAPNAGQSEQMITLVQSVKKNIADIVNVLNQIEEQQQRELNSTNSKTISSQVAIIKKLRNDVSKEDAAIDNALNPFSKRPKTYSSMRRSISTVPNGSAITTDIQERNSLGSKSSSFSMNNNHNDSDNNNPILNNNFNKAVVTTPLNSNNNNISTNNSNKANSVKSGSATSFMPTVSGSSKRYNNKFNADNNFNDWERPQDGVFVDRTFQERMIEQKLKPVDEATVLQTIIDERAVEIEKVHKGILQVQEMFIDLSKLVKEQEINIEKIYDNVEESHTKTKEAMKSILSAEEMHRNGSCVIS